MEKINVAEILKGCPTGMELDCTMYEGVTFVSLDHANYEYYPIKLKTRSGIEICLTRYGQNARHEDSKCVIFPKGKTTWEGFVPPCKFKDGEVVVIECNYSYHYIVFHTNAEKYITTGYNCFRGALFVDNQVCSIEEIKSIRKATDEEKEKLFKAIKDNGYKWNAETNTLEKLPKFKVGDKVESIFNKNQYIITELTDAHYVLVEVNNKFRYVEPIIEDKNWKLIPNKFDITTLKPFECRVLVRNVGAWEPAFWGYYSKEYAHPFVVVGGNTFAQCIPYESNEHLLGTTNDCAEFYKTWKE